MWMWRATASLITALPLLCLLLLRANNLFEHKSLQRRVLTYFNYGFVALYIIARVALLILPFTTL
jgi:uncharacterized membrane protein YcfT